MSGSLNKVMLIGNLGDDVKMHHFEDGGCIGRFPIATNENYTNKQTGEKVINTEWHNAVVRNKAAEICNKYLKKGDKVIVVAGKSKGTVGEILKVFPNNGRALVRGVNLAKRHTKPTQNAAGGIIEKENTINMSNIAFYDDKEKKGLG